MPRAKRGRPYYDAVKGRRMIVPREGGKAIPYVDGPRGFDARRTLRRTGVAGRDLGSGLLDDAARGASAVASRSGFEGGAAIAFLMTVAAGLLGLIFIDLLLSPRGAAATEGLLGSARRGIDKLANPYDPIFGADARKRATEDRGARPAAATQPASARSSSSSTSPKGPTVPVSGRVFPLAPTGAQRTKISFADDFTAPRPSGGMNRAGTHGAIDILAERGTPVVAIEDGELAQVGWNTLGGKRLHVRGASGDWYYAHLDRYAPGVTSGRKVRAGDLLGYVGSTGQAGNTPHLHLAWKPSGAAAYDNPSSLLTELWQALTRPASTQPSTTEGAWV